MVPLHYSELVQQSGQRIVVVPLRQVLSHALTVILLMITVWGAVQLTSLIMDNRRSPGASALATTAGRPVAKDQVQPAGLARSVPTHLTIPAVHVDTDLLAVGLDENGALQVPQHDQAGWYTSSPTPGEVGPAIIDGHVDSISGIAVFWYLRDLQPGDAIIITRQDGSTVHFTVEKSASYDQHNFPTQEVYGNIDYPGLRLITCDGDFDYLTRHYSKNLVIYAKANL